MTTIARRGLVLPRRTLAGLQRIFPLSDRNAAPALATTLLQTRAASSVRDMVREQRLKSGKEVMKGDVKAPAPSAEVQAMRDQMRNRMLHPGLFIPLPLSRWPRKPSEFFEYLWAVTKSSWRARLVTWGMRLRSMPKGSLRPQFRPQPRQVVPTAKALHRRLNEAIAAGDLPALRDVCHEPLYDILSRTIEGRPAAPAGAKQPAMSWEVVEYHSPWTLPRRVFHRVTVIPDSRYGQQIAVVAFDTTQRLTRRDPRTGEVPAQGGVKVQRKRENVVLMRSVDTAAGYKPEEWKVWGFEPETTLKAFVELEKSTKALEQSELMQRARAMGLRK